MDPGQKYCAWSILPIIGSTHPNINKIRDFAFPANFNGVEGVGIYEAGGLYRYTVGKKTNMSDANQLQLQLKAKGFTDAFIVAFSDGKRIPISEAIKLQE